MFSFKIYYTQHILSSENRYCFNVRLVSINYIAIIVKQAQTPFKKNKAMWFEKRKLFTDSKAKNSLPIHSLTRVYSPLIETSR